MWINRNTDYNEEWTASLPSKGVQLRVSHKYLSKLVKKQHNLKIEILATSCNSSQVYG